MSTMLSQSKPRAKSYWSHKKIIRSLLVSPPAVRMYVISAGYYDEKSNETYVEFLPVLGIESTIVEKWSYRSNSEDERTREASREYATTKDLETAGYRYCGQETNHDVLVPSEEYGIIDLTFVSRCVEYQEYRAVACPWPIDQDDARLTAIAAEMLAELRPAADREVAR